MEKFLPLMMMGSLPSKHLFLYGRITIPVFIIVEVMLGLEQTIRPVSYMFIIPNTVRLESNLLIWMLYYIFRKVQQTVMPQLF